jgi:hypothetical protein
MLLKHPVVGRMLNRTTILQPVSISTAAYPFMVGTRTDAIRKNPSVRGIEATPSLISRLFVQTSNFAIIPSTAGKEIQADNSNDSDLIEAPPPKPSTKPSSGRNNRQPNYTNPPTAADEPTRCRTGILGT